MLPLYASSAEQEKMNRHGYSGGGTSPESPQTFFNPGRRVATMGESGRGIGIRTDKYDKCVYFNTTERDYREKYRC